MLDVHSLLSAYKSFHKQLIGFSSLQLITSDYVCLHICLFISHRFQKLGIKCSVVFLRKNRSKTGIYSKMEGEIQELPTCIIDQYTLDCYNISYVQRELELLEMDLIGVGLLYGNKTYNFYTKEQASILTTQKKEPLLRAQIGGRGDVSIHANKTPILYRGQVICVKNNATLVYLNGETFESNKVLELGGVNSEISQPLVVDENIFIIDRAGGNLYKIQDALIKEKYSISDSKLLGDIVVSPDGDKGVVIGKYVSSELPTSMIIFSMNNIEIINEIFFSEEIVYSGVFISHNDYVVSTLVGKIYQVDILSSEKKEIFQLEKEEYISNEITYIKELDQTVFGTSLGNIYQYNFISGLGFCKNLSRYTIKTKILYTDGKLFCGTMCKKIYCLSEEGAVLFIKETQGRIFSNPIYCLGKGVVFGANDGRVYMYDTECNEMASAQITERITNTCLFLRKESSILVQDFMNNIYTIKL